MAGDTSGERSLWQNERYKLVRTSMRDYTLCLQTYSSKEDKWIPNSILTGAVANVFKALLSELINPHTQS